MQYLTRREYAKLKRISRQAVHKGIKAGKIPTVKRKIDEERIPVEDIEMKGVNPDLLTA